MLGRYIYNLHGTLWNYTSMIL
jgi:hypothetical protein